MGITAYFYQFDKRVNSTKEPVQQVGDIGIDVEIKDATNLFSPALILSDALFSSGGVLKTPLKFTYCYLPEFSRYYFVRNWVWLNGRWNCDLEIDFLASHKSAIGNTTAYVLRSASAYDEDLLDNKYLSKSDCHVLANTSGLGSYWHTNMNSSSIADGFYVLGVVNNDNNSIGATSYYAVSGVDLRVFMSQLYASPNWLNITDASISNDLQKILINPIQYIISCTWFPLNLSTSALAGISTIPVGWWDITLPSPSLFYKLTDVYLAYIDESITFKIPKHPASSNTGMAWLQNAPYSTYQFEFYPYGVMQLDSSKLYGFDKIRCRQHIDLVTGQGTLNIIRVKNNANYDGYIYSTVAQVGVPISLAQMSVDFGSIGNTTGLIAAAGLGILSDMDSTNEMLRAGGTLASTSIGGMASVLNNWSGKMDDWIFGGFSGEMPRIGSEINNVKEGSAAAGKWLLNSVGKVAANIGNAILASAGNCQLIGTTGSLAQYYLPHALVLFYYDLAETDPTHYGYPLAKSKKINTLSGFVLCANEGDLQIAGTAMERQAIIEAMTGGFYYE